MQYLLNETKWIRNITSEFKRLNFCPATEERNKEQLLGDLYFFCRKLKLREYFYGGDSTIDKMQQEERCDLNAKLSNRYFNLNNETSLSPF